MSTKKASIYDFSPDPPYDMQHRFKNLENSLQFIQNQRIKELKSNYENLKSEFKNGQDEKTQFSKTIYKKIISHDNQYNFQHDIVGYELDPAVKFNHKYSNTRQEGEKVQERVKKEDLQRKFKHGQVISIQQKRQRLRQQKEIPLTFKHLKMIDTPEFDQMKEVQFYNLIKGDLQEKNEVSSNEIKNSSVLALLKLFKHKFEEQSQYHSKASYDVFFNCDRELNFWKFTNSIKENKKLEKVEDIVLSNCAFLDPYNITIFDMFDFASKNIEVNDLAKFYALKKQLKSKMEMEKNNESLEEKYNEAKKRFEQMKENRLKSKNQRLPLKFASTVAQTNDEMKEKDFEDYFVQNAKDIFDRLKQLNEIRERIIENEDDENFNVMATNIGLQISNQLFKLLLVVLKGEDLSTYSQFIRAQNEGDVERKILELIYLQFKNFRELEVNGFKKVDIIKMYLEEREKNERFYEAFLVQNGNQPKKTPLPNKTKKSNKPKHAMPSKKK